MASGASTMSIPPRVRRAALSVVGDWTAKPEGIVSELGQHHGFTTVGELEAVIGERFGLAEVAAFWDLFTAADDRRASRERERAPKEGKDVRGYDAQAFAEMVLLSVPDQWFAEALDIGHDHATAYAFDLNRYQEASAGIHARIEEMFTANGVPYGYSEEDGRLTFQGDPTLVAVAVQPALSLLDTPSMEDAKRRLLDAMGKAKAGRPDDAIDAARKSVEEGLLTLIAAAENIEVPKKRQANEEFNVLVNGGVLPRYAEELVLSAPRFRGRTDAGHAGGPAVSAEDAEAVIAAAAASLIYLAYTLRACLAA
jgi:hypothetical protein